MRTGRPKGVALCHPELPHYAKQKCYRCYLRDYKPPNKRKPSKYNPATYHRAKAAYRERNLRYKYGLVGGQFAVMCEQQQNRCKICERLFEGRCVPCVDHCHQTGRIRGLLCKECNMGLGTLKDSVPLLTRAIAYLNEAGCE